MAASTATAKILDFTNVKDGGGFNKKRVQSGDYLARITAVADAPSKKDGEFQWVFTIVLDDYKSYAYPLYCKLVENQLWKLRNLCLAAGIAVPKKRMKVDPSKLVGKLIAVTMEDDEYDGKPQSNVAATFPASELDDVAPADEDDEEYEDEDPEDEEDEEEEPAPPARKKAAAKKPAPVEEEDDEDEEEEAEDDEEEEEEEEPEPPKRRAPARKAAPAKKAAPARRAKAAVTDDELEELDIEDV